MFKWLWHRILYGMYPTKFDKRVHERYLEGVEDGKKADARMDNILRTINNTANLAQREVVRTHAVLREHCACVTRDLEQELTGQIVARCEELVADLHTHLLESHEQAAKEGTYNGAEQALKHAVDQILQVMSVEALLKLAQEKERDGQDKATS